jgi:hypothetical protein
MDLIEIIKAWKIANNPSDSQYQLALKRSEICENCPSKKTITKIFKLGIICSECGCPIEKKIYSIKENACPLGKWKNVDAEYFKNIKIKKINSIL